MTDGALDFRRYAPERPRLASSQLEPVVRVDDELGEVFEILRGLLGLTGQCMKLAAAITWRRFREWFETEVLHSLPTAWLLCGTGWGGFIITGLYFQFLA